MTVRLHAVDLGVVALYLVAITAFGLRFGRAAKRGTAAGGGAKEKTLRGYFLADNSVPWWAIALSIVSAETSTLTIIGTPGLAFAGDFGFLQIVLGYMCGRVVVALLFLPKYFQGQMLTAYQLIDRRFGKALYKTTAGLFLLTRAAAEGVRVFAVSIVVGIAIGTGDVLSIAIIAALTLLYTFEGGMAAVIWTDVVQMAIYVGGTLVAIWSLGQHVPGGWAAIHAIAAPAGKFHLLNFAMNLTTTYTFWAGLLGGTFLTMASHGTDQLMVQRMLAAKNLRESQLALLSSGVVIFVQFALFLLIGVGLWVFYGLHPGALAAIGGANGNRIFPGFIVNEMPRGVAGLLVAAILAAAMSNLSAALNSLSSTTVVDFYMGWRPEAKEKERMFVSRGGTVMWALVLFAVAVYAVHAGGKGNVVEIGLSIASVAYGCLLGVFLLGTVTKMATQAGAIVGMVCGFAVNLMLWRWPGVVLPHVAWTWYVLIGAGVTFAVGLGVSLVLRNKRQVGVAAVVLVVMVCVAAAQGQSNRRSFDFALRAPLRMTDQEKAASPVQSDPVRTYDFSAVSEAINRAIGEKKLPGAVVVVGHAGGVVFERAYGVRKYAGEPGLDGKPSPAEAMTEDTIFDMASLTKCLATATAVMQLVEEGKVDVDAPVAKYLPEFGVNGKEKVTVRELLTHYSGLPPDVDLKDAWGLAGPDKAEGIRRAMEAKLTTTPGTKFEYSDVNFITLGVLVERVSGETLDVYAARHIFEPLGMKATEYVAIVCRPYTTIPKSGDIGIYTGIGHCTLDETWIADPERIAPTQHDDQGTKETNPNFDWLLRGTVHDPTARRMGGVAGHAGVFSDAHDMSLFAQAMLDKLLRNTGPFPLKQATLRAMTRPEEPATAEGGATIFRQDGTTTTGIALRGFGWDINSAFSRPRGTIFPTVMTAKGEPGVMPSFGHTGFTGTSLWVDPASDTYVVLLANSVHPRGNAAISPLRGEVATDVGRVLGLDPAYRDEAAMSGAQIGGEGEDRRSFDSALRAPLRMTVQEGNGAPGAMASSKVGGSASQVSEARSGAPGLGTPITVDCNARNMNCDPVSSEPSFLETEDAHLDLVLQGPEAVRVKVGIDVLEGDGFRELKEMAARRGGRLRVGLLTNQTGVDASGRRTIDVLRGLEGQGSMAAHPTHDDKAVMNGAPSIELVQIFSPEHGLFGAKDSTEIGREVDAASGLPVVSLYGAKDADRRPKAEDLKDLDVVVVDLQDAGVRFYTYETVVGYFVEAAKCDGFELVVLDRPALIGGTAVQGPVSDTAASYINYMPEPVRNGMTLGELAGYMQGERSGACTGGLSVRTDAGPSTPLRSAQDDSIKGTGGVTVVKMEGWKRWEFFDTTGVKWVNPSPNLRSVEAATLYPGLGMLDATNVSVGRGTTMPFEVFGAGWMDGKAVADYLTARKIAGVRFSATKFAVAETAEKYPGHGQTIGGVKMTVTDRVALDSPEMGVEILSALRHLYPKEFQLEKARGLVANTATMAGLMRGDDPRVIAAGWAAGLEEFELRRAGYLLYR